MSEFTVCRTLDTHPALRYCLLLDDYRIAGGKPDYRGDNILISWRTKETYGAVDALSNENAKLRELAKLMHRTISALQDTFDASLVYDGVELSAEYFETELNKLGIEVEE